MYFWSAFMLEYLYSKTEGKKDRTRSFNGFNLSPKILQKLPQKCLPYLMEWNDMDTPNKRIEYILQQIEHITEIEQFEPMVCQ